MNTMTESRNLAVQGRQKMTPSEAFVETLVAQGVTDVFGIVGSAYMDALDSVPAGRHPLHLRRARAGRRPHGRRLFARFRPPRRLHRAERSRHHQLRHVDRSGVLGAFAGRRRDAGNGLDDARPRRLPGDRAAADLLEDHQVPGAREQQGADGRATGRAFDRAMLEMGPAQLNIPRDFFYGDIECEIPRPTRDRARRGRRAEPRRRRRRCSRRRSSR